MTQLFYDDDKLRIRVCGGMNCASNGGGRVLEDALQQALEAAGVADEVEIFRAHCLGECHSGPCVRIAGERFYHVQAADAPDLVRDEILPRLK
ncbi:MAG: (2Fe-2S) ferredoxin domain-containing protein [Clostridia bacterium]|nr:(2Fe-2S) ferredoxin domain-containing protein [Clostridia bacterium]